MAIWGSHLAAFSFLVSMTTAGFVEVHVKETTRIGDRIIQLALQSANKSAMEIQSCELAGLYGDVFSCRNGALFLEKKLDYNVKKKYQAELRYVGVGSDITFNTTLLIIVDKVERGPVIEHIYPLAIKEELPVGTYIGRSFSVAPDTDSADYTYSLKGQDSKYLTVNTTGHLLIMEKIDRDAGNDSVMVLKVDIVVTGGNENVFSAPLNITVVDINDNAPEFESDTIELNLNENTQGALHKFVVRDADVGDNAKVKLRILDGNSTFSVRGDTLFVSSPLDYESSSKVNHELVLIILGVDSSQVDTPNTGRTTVIIKILPVNEFAPVWKEPMRGGSGSRVAVQLPDDVTVGSVVTRLLATDNDGGPDGTVTYSITEVTTDKGKSVSGIFAINSDKLVVTSLPPSQSSVLFYDVIVSASDGGQPKKSTLGVIRVNIKPESTNLHDPVWLSPTLNSDNHAIVTIERDTAKLTVIATIRARDKDSGVDGQLEYAISNTTSDDGVLSKYIFLLEPDSGVLRLLRNQAETTVNYFDLEISVTDMGTPQRAIKRTLRVNIKSKDNLRWLSPLEGATGAKVTLSVSKKIQPWTIVTVLNATDSASGETGNKITYKLVSTKTDKGVKVSSPIFLVQVEGEVRTVTSLLRDAVLYYDLEVEAASSNKLRKISGTIRITLKMEVEKPPLTWVSAMSVNVSEAVEPGTTVTAIIARSTSGADDQPIEYSILSATSGMLLYTVTNQI
ncbi:cadherin EGF LAG seven-pass G-type receptor 2-like [Gigantopelta aegis]|uniref:cadherin EGF LAG seven-pass G-type receptor 2-like n=1 Tax=Gigantopelta aegis TaxID=1735272 RepID=UPI001B8897E5|nr:cadherin EGF LAG seven-pass G-type receptor 2-like [Gigantopelta aegis]